MEAMSTLSPSPLAGEGSAATTFTASPRGEVKRGPVFLNNPSFVIPAKAGTHAAAAAFRRFTMGPGFRRGDEVWGEGAGPAGHGGAGT